MKQRGRQSEPRAAQNQNDPTYCADSGKKNGYQLTFVKALFHTSGFHFRLVFTFHEVSAFSNFGCMSSHLGGTSPLTRLFTRSFSRWTLSLGTNWLPYEIHLEGGNNGKLVKVVEVAKIVTKKSGESKVAKVAKRGKNWMRITITFVDLSKLGAKMRPGTSGTIAQVAGGKSG